ncbi:hypothetical protein Runsl_2865 [Runella slithyformis DSM 19594]|uniref:Uncharacterized protein n=1 Tax=Runella slithyformis (strain ATCC 29530 / DSM 19594 / LMG 11500 / NCIMB 11436 / LSU 4) TaxID=761193 RepID=A0A7U3ZL76_RUNSL|nr:hypothetical protein Runsl_2865 [Runella slithyformis DSM 19594]
MSVLLTCFLIGLIFLPYFKTPTKLVLIYITISFFNECLGYYSLYYSAEKKVRVLEHNLYLCIYFIILTLYFSNIIIYTKKRIAFIASICTFFLSFFYSIQTINQTFHYQQFIILALSFAFYSLIYFKQLLETEEAILENPNFWIVTGILFFHGGYFFLSGFISFIASNDLELARKLFKINNILNIIYYSLIIYGFLCQRRLMKLS